MNIFAN